MLSKSSQFSLKNWLEQKQFCLHMFGKHIEKIILVDRALQFEDQESTQLGFMSIVSCYFSNNQMELRALNIEALVVEEECKQHIEVHNSYSYNCSLILKYYNSPLSFDYSYDTCEEESSVKYSYKQWSIAGA